MTARSHPAVGYVRSAIPQLAILGAILLLDRLVNPSFFNLALIDGRVVGSAVDVLDRAAPVAHDADPMSIDRQLLQLG